MKRLLVLCAGCLFTAGLFLASAQAGEVDILVEKLVKKGILTKQDAAEIIKDVKEEAAQEKDAERQELIRSTKEAVREDIKKDPKVFAEALPRWIRKMQLKGDLRLRYQHTDRDEKAERNQGRYRFRLGVVTQLNDKVDVGFGVASGDSNPRSTNEDMNNTFERGDVRLDYAYARYKPYSWMSLVGGKFENPLFLTTDMLWDSDIRPEGASVVFNHPVYDWLDVFATTGYWVVDERKDDENDPTMYVVQPGTKIKLGKYAYFKNAITYYQFDNVKNTTLDYTSKSNTLRKFENTLKYDYDALAVTGELGWKTPYARMPFVALFGEAVKNTSAGQGDTGYAAGFRAGSDKVKKRHDWQFMTRYMKLERDAWVDALTDADNYDGETNIKGYKAAFTYGLFDNIDFAMAYFNHERISGESLDEKKLQLDLNFRF
jgi:polyhydroxyalkanoate synthesis regulator phasin